MVVTWWIVAFLPSVHFLAIVSVWPQKSIVHIYHAHIAPGVNATVSIPDNKDTVIRNNRTINPLNME